MDTEQLSLAKAFADALGTLLTPRWRPLSHQIPPPGTWEGWLLLAGRGAGKSAACSHYMNEHAMGPPCMPGPVPHWMGIIAPTLGDAATSGFYGPSGLRSMNPDTRLVSGHGGTVIRWPNGSEAKLFGTHGEEDIERLRSGGNRCLIWAEEMAAWPHIDDAWDHMQFGLRLGVRPHWVGSTTPKAKQLIKDFVAGKHKNIVLTGATTDDNPHLPEHIRQKLFDRYGKTTLGAQELYGRLIDQDENALWTRDMIERNRVDEIPGTLSRITIGVDPSGGQGEQGIVAVGRVNIQEIKNKRMRTIAHGYVLGDYTTRTDPAGWGRRAVQCAVDFGADNIAVETNFGGDMAISVIKQALDNEGLYIPVRKITASRGKRPRAEPVAALASIDRLHHIGVFERLEDQQCIWTPEESNSPDRMDAMVWGAWETRLVSVMTTNTQGSTPLSTMSRTKVG